MPSTTSSSVSSVFRLLDSDGAFLADLLHGVRHHVAYGAFSIRRRCGSDLGDLLACRHRFRHCAARPGARAASEHRRYDRYLQSPAFFSTADLEWNKACRYNRAFTLLLLDIDYFKSINDTYGHQAGDDVIVHLANLAGSCRRRTSMLARLGSSKSLRLLLPETELPQALICAERLREELAAHPTSSHSSTNPSYHQHRCCCQVVEDYDLF